jgi:hypothetical protein
MAMINMAREVKRGETENEVAALGDDDKYPYGLRINLNSEVLEKLGLDKTPSVGVQLCIEANVKVIGVRSEEEQDGTTENAMELQITDMMFCDPVEEKKDPAEALYGKSE